MNESREINVCLDSRMTGADGIPDADVVFVGDDEPYLLATIDKSGATINIRVGGERDHVLNEMVALIHDALVGVINSNVTEDQYHEYIRETFPEKLT